MCFAGLILLLTGIVAFMLLDEMYAEEVRPNIEREAGSVWATEPVGPMHLVGGTADTKSVGGDVVRVAPSTAETARTGTSRGGAADDQAVGGEAVTPKPLGGGTADTEPEITRLRLGTRPRDLM